MGVFDPGTNEVVNVEAGSNVCMCVNCSAFSIVLPSCLYRSTIWREEKTAVDSCALQKMLLVVFFHHRALPPFTYSTGTGCSRASFRCLSLGRHRNDLH